MICPNLNNVGITLLYGIWANANLTIVAYYKNKSDNCAFHLLQGQITLMDAPVFKEIQPEVS